MNALSCAPGEIGRVVVTPLYSTAQPLIRYEQGDMATPGDCSCGVNCRCCGKLTADRTHLHLPGRLATEMLVNKDMLDTLRADAFQVAQIRNCNLKSAMLPMQCHAPARQKSTTLALGATSN